MVAVDWYGGLSKWRYTGEDLNSRLNEQGGEWEVGCICIAYVISKANRTASKVS